MLKYYRNCDELPIYNFYKIIETKSFSYLYKKSRMNTLYFYFRGKMEWLGTKTKIKLIKFKFSENKAWNELYEGYLEKFGDNETLRYYELIGEVMRLTTRYKVVFELLKAFTITSVNEKTLDLFIDALKKWGYKINKSKDIQSEIKRMYQKLKQSENRIRIKENELKELTKKNETEKSLTLTEQQVKLEQGLGRNEINVKTISVTKWFVMINEFKELMLQRQKQSKQNG